ncbi:MAG: hypothetical protein WBA76_02645 [Phormidesmis sp.]
MAIELKDTALDRCLKVASAIITTVIATGAIANISTPAASAQETVLDKLENINEQRSGGYYDHQSIFSQIRFISGIGGFPDQRIHRDAAALSEAHKELSILQTQSTVTIRVPDLPNPYTTSVQLLPTSQINSRVVGSELNFEPLPRR